MLGILVIGIFLMLSAIVHLIFPVYTDKVLHKPNVIRLIGGLLVIIGAFSISALDIYARIIGWSVLLSGAARLVVPKKMIRINEWTSRYMHAAIMIVCAIICFVYYCQTIT
jgi:hypothetical protein